VPDFRVADTAPEHPKLRAAGLAAAGLWSLAGAWSMRELTDGWVPEYWVASWPQGSKQAAALVRVGLWRKERRSGIDGYRFHDFLDYQRASEQFHGERAKARERAAKSRARRAERAPHADRDVTRDVRSGHNEVTQAPSPSPITTSGPVDLDGTSPERADDAGAPRPIPFPDGWTPHEGHTATARRRGIDLTQQAEQFEAHARAHGRLAVDWDAAFTVWLGSARPANSRGSGTSRSGTTNGTDAAIAALLNVTTPAQQRAIGGSR
jgi:hypothetical protein